MYLTVVTIASYTNGISPNFGETNLEGDKNFQEAIKLFNKGKYEEVIKILAKLLQKYPNHAKVHCILAAAYHKSGKIDLAIQEFKKAIELESKNPEYHFALGGIYFETKQYRLAAAVLEEAVNLKPDEPKYKKLLSQAYYQIAYNEYYLNLTTDPEVWRENNLKCEEFLKKALAADPDNAEAHEVLGEVYREFGGVWLDQKRKDKAQIWYDEAEKEYLKALELNPASTTSLAAYSLAEIYYKLERYDLARKFLNLHLSRHPHSLLGRELEEKMKSKEVKEK